MLPLLEKEARERQLAVLKKGREIPVTEIIPEREHGEARVHAARIVDVNPHYVNDFKKVLQVRPDLADKIRSGNMKLVEAKRELSHIFLGDDWTWVSSVLGLPLEPSH
jgi:hypothetical protein